MTAALKSTLETEKERSKCMRNTYGLHSFCSKLHAHFQSMEVRNSSFAAFIDVFTANTYVMVIMSDSTICEYLPSVSIKLL